MERNERLETNIAKALNRIATAQQMIYNDPDTARQVLESADEDIHKAIDTLLPRNRAAMA